MTFYHAALLCFCLATMIGFPYGMVWLLFYTDRPDTPEDTLFRSYIARRLKVAALLVVAGGVFTLLTLSTGA
jgi:hypothetical protein